MKRLLSTWDNFFFAPVSAAPMGLFRIFYGFLLLVDATFLRPEWLIWFGDKGVLPIAAVRETTGAIRLNLFLLMPQGDGWVVAYYYLFIFFTIMLTVGLFTRFSSVMVFMLLISLHHRNLYILNLGDGILRATGFFLIFSSAGDVFSFDRLRRVLQGKEGRVSPQSAPWAQRLIQIQVSLAYLITVYWKFCGPKWRDGTAVYYVLLVEQLKRFPFPIFLHSMWASYLFTWGTLLAEISLGIFIWFKPLRYPVLLMGLLLHLTMEYMLNIQLFEWIMLSTYVTFVYPEDLAAFWQRVVRLIHRLTGPPLKVVYDRQCNGCCRIISVLCLLDILQMFIFQENGEFKTDEAASNLRQSGKIRVLFSSGRWVDGGAAWCVFAKKIPMLWVALPALYFVVSASKKNSI